MRQTITDRKGPSTSSGGTWQVEAKPGTMSHLKQFMQIVFRLFDLEKCRDFARSLEKARGFTTD